MATEAEIIASNILASAIEYKRLYDTTKKNEYKVKEQRLRQIAENIKLIVSSTSSSSVSSFNGRTGAVILSSADVTGALGYTPGDMLKSIYDYDNDGVVDSAERTEIIVRNSTGSTLTKGTVVYLSGATGNRPNALRAQANSEATSSKTFGFVVSDIADNSDGYVACAGTLHDLDTSAFADGVALWLSPSVAGGWTTTVPSEPNHSVFLGYVARSHPTQGRVVILIQNGYELNELHDVVISSPSNGQILRYNSTNAYWENWTPTYLTAVPTLDQVTTAGNTTTNAITVGGLTAATNLIYTDTVNSRVGIGTTSPSEKLHIRQDQNGATQIRVENQTNGTNSRASISVGTPGDALTMARYLSNYTTVASWANRGGIITDSGLTNGFFFRTAAGSITFQPASTDDKVVFASSGNVLINTTTDAGYKLDVNGTLRTVNSALFATTSGSVSIGTTTAPFKFTLIDGGATYVAQFRGSNSTYIISGDTSLSGESGLNARNSVGQLFLGINPSAEAYFSGTSGATALGFYLAGTSALYVNSVRNIGIGTTSPTYKVDVQGTTLATSSVSVQGAFNIFRVAAPTGTLTLTPSAGGSVDVGQHYYFVTFTTALGETNTALSTAITIVSGSQTVTITGIPVSTDPRVTGRKIYRTRAGQTSDRGMVIATIADNTTTSYVDTAADSTFPNLGDWGAYRDNTTSRQITIDGTKAMALGTSVTSIGFGAGASVTTAGLTTLVGYNAGNAITYGFQNTLVGTQAGRFVTTGSGNTVLGSYSLMWVSTGSDNIAVGRGASFYNVTGSYNIAIGGGALSGQSGASHNSNIGIGSGALANLGAADNNVAIGYHAGRYISSGSNNTLSSNSIFIGYDARPNANSETNQIVIGYNGRGLGSNTTVIGNSSTTFTSIPAGNMTVGGTTNAGYRLDVNGTARIQSNLTVDTDTLFVDATNNRVGIGTTTPGDKLSIVDASNANIFGRITANGTNASAAWVAQNDQVDNVVYRVFGSAVTGSQMGISLARSASLMANLGGSGKFLVGTYSATDFVMGTGNAEKVRIVDSTGNFLIGTTSDNGNKLQVNGTIDGQAFALNGVNGWTGTIMIATNPPGMQNIDVQSGIIMNVF